MSGTSPAHVGVWSQLGEPAFAAALGSSGAAWVGLDMQHGHYDDRAIRDALRYRRQSAATYLVRTVAADSGLIGRALDAGADGVIVPMINTPESAAAVVDAARYPPAGSRSYGPLSSVGDYSGVDLPSSKPFVAVMVETQSGLDAVDAIAGVAGVDMIFVGPFDLALSLGCSLDELVNDRTVSGALARIVRACKINGIAAGAFGGTRDRAQLLIERGFDWVASCTEATIIRDGFTANSLV